MATEKELSIKLDVCTKVRHQDIFIFLMSLLGQCIYNLASYHIITKMVISWLHLDIIIIIFCTHHQQSTRVSYYLHFLTEKCSIPNILLLKNTSFLGKLCFKYPKVFWLVLTARAGLMVFAVDQPSTAYFQKFPQLIPGCSEVFFDVNYNV